MTSYKHSLPLALLFVHVFFLLAITVSARPTSRQPSDPRAIPTDVLKNESDIQTMETIQVFTMSGGNTTETCTLVRTSKTTANGQDAIVFSENCSFVFTPTSSPVSTHTPVSPSSRSNASITTFSTSAAPASTGKVLFSMFTTSAPPVSASAVADPVDSTITSSPTIATAAVSRVATSPATAVNDTALSTALPDYTSLPSPTPSPSSSSADPFTATAQSHLSSLPIFLGAFGGIAGLALLVVGIKVYRPVQRFNEMRLRTSSVASTRTERGLWGLKRWRHSGERDSEKLTGRNSQDTELGSANSHEPPSAWMS